jgi:hypothetical protein
MPKRMCKPRRLSHLSPSRQHLTELDHQDEYDLECLQRSVEHLKWKTWLKTPEAMVDILRDPTLLKPPHIRNSKILKMLEKIKAESRARPGIK